MDARSSWPLRVARPTSDLTAAERFWTTGLGLHVIARVAPQTADEHPLLILGWPGAAWHLELVADADAAHEAAPGTEDLLVLYLGEPVSDALVEALTDAGGVVVPSRNPYWDEWGVTVVDPDGYRLVLSHRTWAP